MVDLVLACKYFDNLRQKKVCTNRMCYVRLAGGQQIFHMKRTRHQEQKCDLAANTRRRNKNEDPNITEFSQSLENMLCPNPPSQRRKIRSLVKSIRDMASLVNQPRKQRTFPCASAKYRKPCTHIA